MRWSAVKSVVCVSLGAASWWGCGANQEDLDAPPLGPSRGGSAGRDSALGGALSPGGATGMGGVASVGGSTSVGGGTTSTSGTTSTGGTPAAGGTNNPGGTNSAGGKGNTGGTKATAGSTSSSGSAAVAGSTSTGGGTTTGGGTARGGTSAAGGALVGGAGAATAGGNMTGGMPASACGPLLERIITSTTTTPEGVRAGVSNWRVWAQSSLGITPVFTAPLANCGTLVCYTSGTGSGTSATRRARVARLDATDQLVTTHDLGAYECRGLAAEPDGHFAALLWAPGTATDCNDYTQNGRIYLSRFDSAGTAGWTTELTNTSTSGLGPNCPTEWGIGESRMEFGGGRYGAYYHVHSQSGHEGDTLKYVDLAGAETTTWSWGCSHSMSHLLRFNPTDAAFMPACVTDCYPGTTATDFATGSIGGIYINNRNRVMDVDGGCNGRVAAELGGGAIAPSGWKIVFNAHQNAAAMGQSSYNTTSMNQDIGFASIAAGLTLAGSVVWLTTTTTNEADSAIARFASTCEATEQYLVGWSEAGTAYKLGRVDAAGSFIEAPVDATAVVHWGRRDDPFRAHVNGDIVWAWFDAAGSTTLHFARVRSGGTAQCAAF